MESRDLFRWMKTKSVLSIRERHHLQVLRRRRRGLAGTRERISVITSDGSSAIGGFSVGYFEILVVSISSDRVFFVEEI